MYLLLAPSDIFYVTGVTVHEVGEILIIYNKKQKAESRKQKIENSTRDGDGFHLASFDGAHDLAGMTERIIVLCDARTSGLFDSARFEIIETRTGWGEKLKKYKKIFTDPDYLTQTLREKIEGYGPALVMRKSPITASRMIKTPEEIAKLRESQRINRAVYEAIQPFLQIGITEQEIARRIQILQLELGASGPSFPPIVAFGENTAVPHHSPTSRELYGDDSILIDMGVIYRGYCSDMTRCICAKLGDDVSGVRREYTLLMDVTHHIISWAKPGMRMCDLDREARRMLGKYSKCFTHSLGHGVGLEIHESPRVSGKSREILRPGMVITIEPGVYGLTIQNTKDKIQKEGSPCHPELVSGSIPDEPSCTFGGKSTKTIRGTKTRYMSCSAESLNSSRSNSFSPETPFLNREKIEAYANRQIYGLRYEEMVLVDKEKLTVL